MLQLRPESHSTIRRCRQKSRAAQQRCPGLTAAEARAQLAQLGPNAVREERPHPLLQFLGHFWAPIPWFTGLTGLRIIDAILSGQRDPEQLVKLRDKRVYKSTPRQMQAALVGDYRPEHLFVLSQSLQAYRFYQARIEECDREIEPLLEKLAQQVEAASAKLNLDALKPSSPKHGATRPEPLSESKSASGLKAKRKHKPRANEPKIELAGLLERICGIDLTKVVGLNVLNVLLIVSEIGVDMSKWRSAKAFCSWLGLCPGNKISGDKVLDSRTRQVVNRVADALRLAAQSAGRTETCLGIFYRRKLAHLGAPKATTATARKMACLIYHLLKYKQPYQEPDPAIYQLRLRKSALTKLQRQAIALGRQIMEGSNTPNKWPGMSLREQLYDRTKDEITL